MATVSDVIALAEKLWPSNGAEEWDRPGLVCGSSHAKVSKVLLSVDVNAELIEDAIDGSFDMIVSHHPLLLRGVTDITENSAKGSVLTAAIKNDIALFSAHTNADIVENGVSDVLAKSLGLSGLKPLVAGENPNVGHGRVGLLAQPISLLTFARQIASTLSATAGGVRVAGNADMRVSRVALCGGAGDSFMASAFESGADVYVTSDLRHHPVSEALERAKAEGGEFAIIDNFTLGGRIALARGSCKTTAGWVD